MCLLWAGEAKGPGVKVCGEIPPSGMTLASPRHLFFGGFSLLIYKMGELPDKRLSCSGI